MPRQVRTLLVNKTYTVPYAAACYASPLSFSNNLVTLPATAWHATSTHSVEVKNVSKHAQMFEFAPPPGSHLTISPLVTTLAPGGVTRVQFDFTPKLPVPEPETELETELEAEDPKGRKSRPSTREKTPKTT
eukprot:2115479-Pyramimonas_sp.AAC.1